MGSGIHINEPVCTATPNKKLKKDDMPIVGYGPSDEYTDNKGKGIIIHRDPEIHTGLIVGIGCAREIDRETKDPSGDKRIYHVYGWVVGGGAFLTEDSGSLPNPEWCTRYKIYSGRFNSGLVLNLEVYRNYCLSGPGTANGTALVGRCQVPLPKVFCDREARWYGLVTPDGSAAGYIFVELELRSIELKK